MTLLALENRGRVARLGLSVPRRVGTAPTRNRAKRRFREIFRRFPDLLEGSQRDICLIVRPEAAQATYRDLREEFGRLYRKALSSARPSSS